MPRSVHQTDDLEVLKTTDIQKPPRLMYVSSAFQKIKCIWGSIHDIKKCDLKEKYTFA